MVTFLQGKRVTTIVSAIINLMTCKNVANTIQIHFLCKARPKYWYGCTATDQNVCEIMWKHSLGMCHRNRFFFHSRRLFICGFILWTPCLEIIQFPHAGFHVDHILPAFILHVHHSLGLYLCSTLPLTTLLLCCSSFAHSPSLKQNQFHMNIQRRIHKMNSIWCRSRPRKHKTSRNSLVQIHLHTIIISRTQHICWSLSWDFKNCLHCSHAFKFALI